MPTIDLSLTITAIIAICALISPIATALINNHHQIRIKQLEYEQQEKAARVAHEQDIYEGYIRAAGACIQSHTTDALQAFGSHSSLVAYYVPENLREDIIKLEKMIRSENKSEKIDLLAHITANLRALQRTK